MKRRRMDLVTKTSETDTSLKEGHRDWASLPLPVVDELVRVLKDTRRWRLDGRSLRLLNRHWSTAVSIHVEEIRPDFTRTIVGEDIASLPKFERATSVDISPLLTPPEHRIPENSEQEMLLLVDISPLLTPPEHRIPEKSEQEMLLLVDISPLLTPPEHRIPEKSEHEMFLLEKWYEERLERIVITLCRMPALTQIEVGLETLIILHSHCATSQEQFSRLDGITSLYLYNDENLRQYGKTHLNTAWTWARAGEKHSDASSVLTQLVCSLGRLETLEVDGSVLDSCTQFGFLDQVNHVTLNGVDSKILSKLPNASAAVSSVVDFSGGRYLLDMSVELTRLDGLSINLYEFSPEDLDKVSLTPESKYLKVLDLDYLDDFDIYAFKNETITAFRQLECLNINASCFAGASLRGNFPDLRALRIGGCTLTDSDVMFVTQFRKLELLKWRFVKSPEYWPLHLPWKELKLPKLRSLNVIPILDDFELQSISQQTNLEVLHIGSYYDSDSVCTSKITNEGILLLEKLSNLRILYIDASGARERGIWSSLLSTNFVTKLEQLWTQIYPVCDEDKDNLKRIKCISPHLILNTG